MALFKNTKNIIIAVVIIIALFVGYKMFFGGADAPPITDTTDGIGDAQPNAVGNDILTLLLQLRSIKLDGAFLASPVLASLTDFNVDLEPVDVGRTQPYAQIGIERSGALFDESTTRQQPANPTPLATTSSATTTSQE